MVSVEDLEDDQKLVVKFVTVGTKTLRAKIREAYSPLIFVMIGRPSRPPPATRAIVMVSVFCDVCPSGERTSAFTTTSLLIVSPSNVRAIERPADPAASTRLRRGRSTT